MQLGTLSRITLTLLAASLGCTSPDIGSDSYEARNCPDPPCDPPDDPPDDPPPDDPPPPPQPDPAKFRERFIPLAYVVAKLDFALGGTTIQVSHTTGTPRTFHHFAEHCETHTTPEVLECRAACNELDVPPWQKAQCREQCGESTTTCEEFCSSTDSLNWLRWGNVARAASALNDPKSCNATTCPACNPPMLVPSLEDRWLPIPIFDESYTAGPFTYHITCRVNRWVFQLGGNITASATPSGLSLSIPGATGDPAIPCDNAPDVEVDGLAMQVTFRFPTFGMNIGADGTLLGDWDVIAEPIEFLADLNGLIETAVTNASHDALNTAAARSAYRSAFTTLVGQFVSEVTHEQLDNLTNVQSTHGGLTVRYWVR
jgi:hypothetical protein